MTVLLEAKPLFEIIKRPMCQFALLSKSSSQIRFQFWNNKKARIIRWPVGGSWRHQWNIKILKIDILWRLLLYIFFVLPITFVPPLVYLLLLEGASVFDNITICSRQRHFATGPGPSPTAMTETGRMISYLIFESIKNITKGKSKQILLLCTALFYFLKNEYLPFKMIQICKGVLFFAKGLLWHFLREWVWCFMEYNQVL